MTTPTHSNCHFCGEQLRLRLEPRIPYPRPVYFCDCPGAKLNAMKFGPREYTEQQAEQIRQIVAQRKDLP